MGLIWKSNKNDFLKKHAAFKELVQARMAMDIEISIKTSGRTPVDTGGMKSEVRHFKSEKGGYRVEAGKEYSAVQEAGVRRTGKGAPTAQFEHYSTPGTGAGWFQSAIDATLRNRVVYIEEATKAVGL